MLTQNQQTLTTLLQKYNIRPNKKLGQNFLTDVHFLQLIIDAAEIEMQDYVLEIGAGLGHLSKQLAQVAKQVFAIELDKKLIPALEEHLRDFTNVQIIQGDILQMDLDELIQDQEYLVVANIPYYITSSIIRNLLESASKPKRIILTIQYEVAQRVCAKAGDLSVLALSVQLYGTPELLQRIPSGAFYPSPQVDSGIIRITLHPEPLLADQERDVFFTLIKAGFLHKRKTLRNSLSKGLGWSKDKVEDLLSNANIETTRRAETLNFNEWLELIKQYIKI